MGKFDIFDTIDELRKSGQPFCVVTVVRTADVTSAKAGAKAAVTNEGEILGHLGGACVNRAVKEAGQEAIASGETRMIRVKPSESVVSLTDDDGAQVFKSGCPSGGTVDLLIEPYELPPLLVVFGNTPISRAIASHATLAGFRVAAPVDMAFEDATQRFEGTDVTDLDIRTRDFVVVASQGSNDLASLKASLESPARRVSMVASRRKAEALGSKLIAAGVPDESLVRLKSPAGLDLGGIDPHEIALSVMAEIVRWRNSDARNSQEDKSDEELA